MHSKIIQLSSEPIGKDDYISEGEFYDELDNIEPVGADYVRDIDEEDVDDIVFRILGDYSDICDIDRDNRRISLKQNPDWSAYDKTLEELKQKITGTFADMLTSDENVLWRMRMFSKTVSDSYTCFYVNGCIETENEFIKCLLKDGPLYVGGVVDYHW